MSLETMDRDQLDAELDLKPCDRSRLDHTPRRADCHPHRPHAGHGMCVRCYGRWYRSQPERSMT